MQEIFNTKISQSLTFINVDVIKIKPDKLGKNLIK